MKSKTSPKKKTIVQKHSNNFETLRSAFLSGNVALVDCALKSTGEHVAVICATSETADHNVQFTPFVMFFNGNPYDLLIPPGSPEY